MIRQEPSIPDKSGALSVVRDYLARYREYLWDAHDIAGALGLSEAEVQFALEALTIEGELLS